ncbi:MAG: hypothetical protein VXY66_03010, partial [Pseudomonadota bacterium]|nr:hypothetical protein [Pseudomonadota bacterium]
NSGRASTIRVMRCSADLGNFWKKRRTSESKIGWFHVWKLSVILMGFELVHSLRSARPSVT